MQKNLTSEEKAELLEISNEYLVFKKKYNVIQERLAAELGDAVGINLSSTSNLSGLATIEKKLKEDRNNQIGRLSMAAARKFRKLIADPPAELIAKISRDSTKKKRNSSKLSSAPVDEYTEVRVAKISGTYDLYRLSSNGKEIKQYPIVIHDNKATVYDYFRDKTGAIKLNKYHGEAVFLDKECFAIRLTGKNGDWGFHPRMIFQIPEHYQDYRFDYVEGISIRVGKTHSPTASKDILVFRSGKVDDTPPFVPSIEIDTPQYLELNRLPNCKGIAFHLTGFESNVVKASPLPNERTPKTDLSSVYFLAGCACVLAHQDTKDYFERAQKLKFNDKDIYNEFKTFEDIREHLKNIRFKRFKF